MKTPFALLLTGKPNSGKSTIAYALVQKRLRNTLIIDGDRHREAQFLGRKLGFSREDIMRNNEHVIKLARFAQEQMFNVLIPQITPYKAQSWAMRSELANFYEVLLHCRDEVRADRPNYRESELSYEFDKADLALFTDRESVDDCVDKILELLDSEA